MSIDLIIAKSRNGKGVFANKDFKERGKILKLQKGKLISYEEIDYDKKEDRYLQVDKKLYFNPFGNLINFLNHSCDPNTGVIIRQNEIYIMSIKNISAGEEIIFDYSTTMDEDDWTMKCNCGSKNCRKIIRSIRFLPDKLFKKYKTYIPKFLQKSYIENRK